MKTKSWLLSLLIIELLFTVWFIFPKLIHTAHLTVSYLIVAIFGLAWSLIDVSRQNDRTGPAYIQATVLRLAIALGFLLLVVLEVTTR